MEVREIKINKCAFKLLNDDGVWAYSKSYCELNNKFQNAVTSDSETYKFSILKRSRAGQNGIILKGSFVVAVIRMIGLERIFDSEICFLGFNVVYVRRFNK